MARMPGRKFHLLLFSPVLCVFSLSSETDSRISQLQPAVLRKEFYYKIAVHKRSLATAQLYRLKHDTICIKTMIRDIMELSQPNRILIFLGENI